MVLSKKKLKQKLRLELAKGAQAQPTRSEENLPPPADPSNKQQREKKRQRKQQLVSSSEGQAHPPNDADAPPINKAEIDRCLDKHDGVERDEHDSIDVSEPKPKKKKRNEVALPKTKISQRDWVDYNSPEKLQGPTSKTRAGNLKNENHNLEQQEEKLAGDHSLQSAEDQGLTDPRTVYVGGIPYFSSEDDIRAFFGDCGTISEVNSKTFLDSGKFRGIALLTFKTEGGAQRALALDGANMGGRFLKVQRSASKPKETVKREVYKEPPSKTEGYTRAYIGNLSWDITEQDIKGFFKDCKIDAVRFSLNKTTGEFQGFGHVDFADDQSLELALHLDQQDVLGRPIKVAYAVPKRNENNKDNFGKTFRDKKCYSCGEKGHISSRCPNTGKGI